MMKVFMPMEREEQFTTKGGVNPLLIRSHLVLPGRPEFSHPEDNIKMLYSYSQNLNAWLQAVDALMHVLLGDAHVVSCRNVSFCGFELYLG